jgi:hypothetical protein
MCISKIIYSTLEKIQELSLEKTASKNMLDNQVGCQGKNKRLPENDRESILHISIFK